MKAFAKYGDVIWKSFLEAKALRLRRGGDLDEESGFEEAMV